MEFSLLNLITPGLKADLIRNVQRDVREIFPITSLYLANIPTYPSGLWAFTIGSKKYNPLEIPEERFHEIETKYYTKELHKAAFVLPKFVQDLLKK